MGIILENQDLEIVRSFKTEMDQLLGFTVDIEVPAPKTIDLVSEQQFTIDVESSLIEDYVPTRKDRETSAESNRKPSKDYGSPSESNTFSPNGGFLADGGESKEANEHRQSNSVDSTDWVTVNPSELSFELHDEHIANFPIFQLNYSLICIQIFDKIRKKKQMPTRQELILAYLYAQYMEEISRNYNSSPQATKKFKRHGQIYEKLLNSDQKEISEEVIATAWIRWWRTEHADWNWPRMLLLRVKKLIVALDSNDFHSNGLHQFLNFFAIHQILTWNSVLPFIFDQISYLYFAPRLACLSYLMWKHYRASHPDLPNSERMLSPRTRLQARYQDAWFQWNNDFVWFFGNAAACYFKDDTAENRNKSWVIVVPANWHHFSAWLGFAAFAFDIVNEGVRLYLVTIRVDKLEKMQVFDSNTDIELQKNKLLAEKRTYQIGLINAIINVIPAVFTLITIHGFVFSPLIAPVLSLVAWCITYYLKKYGATLAPPEKIESLTNEELNDVIFPLPEKSNSQDDEINRNGEQLTPTATDSTESPYQTNKHGEEKEETTSNPKTALSVVPPKQLPKLKFFSPKTEGLSLDGNRKSVSFSHHR